MSKAKISSDKVRGALEPRGQLLVISAPSGSGKTTLVHGIMARAPGVTRAVTYTTRPPRVGEQDGRDYHFTSLEAFERLRERGEFLEWASVHDNLYGTSRREVASLCDQGLDVLLVIDCQGADSLRKQGMKAVYIFILPPSLEELEHRLRQRRSEDEATLRRRLSIARQEMAHYHLYDYVIVNDDLETAMTQLQAIIQAEHCRVEHLRCDHPIFMQLHGWDT